MDEGEIATFRRREQCMNASLSMEWTVDGMLMCINDIQSWNACRPISRRPSLRLTSFNEEHPQNEKASMALTVDGMLTRCKYEGLRRGELQPMMCIPEIPHRRIDRQWMESLLGSVTYNQRMLQNQWFALVCCFVG